MTGIVAARTLARQPENCPPTRKTSLRKTENSRKTDPLEFFGSLPEEFLGGFDIPAIEKFLDLGFVLFLISGTNNLYPVGFHRCECFCLALAEFGKFLQCPAFYLFLGQDFVKDSDPFRLGRTDEITRVEHVGSDPVTDNFPQQHIGQIRHGEAQFYLVKPDQGFSGCAETIIASKQEGLPSSKAMAFHCSCRRFRHREQIQEDPIVPIEQISQSGSIKFQQFRHIKTDPMLPSFHRMHVDLTGRFGNGTRRSEGYYS